MIVPYKRRGTPANVVQLATDGVAADVRLVATGDGRGSVYRLRVASADADVAGRLVGVRSDGAIDELGSLRVAAGSLGGARISAERGVGRPYASVYLEISGPRIALRVEAPRSAPPRGSAVRAGIWCVAIGGVVATVFLTFIATTQRAAPVGAGAAIAPVATVRTAATLPPAPARIAALSARRERDSGADVVDVAYLAVADAGTLTLADAAGIPLRSAAFTRDGIARFEVPVAYRRSSVVAKIDVRRGASNAVASVALAPLPEAPSAVPAVVAAPAAVPTAPAATPALAGIEGPAIAGGMLRVRVTPLSRGGRFELQDAGGATVAAIDAAPGAREVRLPLPASVTSLFLVTRYDRNGAEETVVQPIEVRPH